jgi:spermidine synthase
MNAPRVERREVSPGHFYAGLFLVTACTLMLQVIQTRILSVVAWYHLAFFAISMAMFGITTGAVWVYLQRDRFTPATLAGDLPRYSLAFAVSTALCLLVQMTLAPVVMRTLSSVWTWVELALCLAVPFFFSGVVVSLALTRSAFPIGRVYAIDLAGAATGCLGVLALLNLTDGPSAVLWVAALAAAGSLAFALAHREAPGAPRALSLRAHTAILAVLAGGALLNGSTPYGFQPLVAKNWFEDGGSHIFRRWNTFSRIAVYPEATTRPHLWGPSQRFADQAALTTQRMLNIDGDAGTFAYRFRGDLREVDFLRYDITTLAYCVPGRDVVAIIGVGAGRDILSAALFGARSITGVEINPIFVELLTREPGFAEFTDLSTLRGVRLVVDEGRSWFARTGGRFDLVQMSLIDTWAATGAGAFSLSENGLYTVEAWKVFLSRLTPGGVYTVSRWYNPQDPSETGRMLSLAAAALIELEQPTPAAHLFLATQGSIATLIVSAKPLGPRALDALHAATDYYGYRVLVSPRGTPGSPLLAAIAGATDAAALRHATEGLAFDLSPPTDDRPFFFNQVPMNQPVQALLLAKRLIGAGGGIGGVRSGNLVASATLLILFVIALVLVIATIVVPLRSALRDAGPRLAVAGTLYFLLIGIGFMLVEIGLLQRMSVFLGHPVYSLSVSLFTLILSTGAGSLASERLALHSRALLSGWAALAAAYVIALPRWLPATLAGFEGQPLLLRALVCTAVIAPAGLLMGFAFPTGMRLVAAIDARPAPWFWGINGAAGVLASVAAVALSIALGIGATVTLGGLCYLLLVPLSLVLMPASPAGGALPVVQNQK